MLPVVIQLTLKTQDQVDALYAVINDSWSWKVLEKNGIDPMAFRNILPITGLHWIRPEDGYYIGRKL